MTIDFYYKPGSAPCRAVWLVAKAVGVDLNLKHTDLMKGEHLTPEFVKMNPQHTIPTLDDNGLALWESRAIIMYLADKYGKDDSLYPKDPKKRAVVNQRLFFDMGTLYQRFGDAYYPVMFAGATLDDSKVKKLEEALGYLDKFLDSSKFAAGDDLTIADHSLVASVSTAEAVGFDVNQFPNVARWYSECKSSMVGYQECNADGAEAFKQLWLTLSKK